MAIPPPAGHVHAFEVGVVGYSVHRFGCRQALNFLARHAVVNRHLRRSSGADKEPVPDRVERHVSGAVTPGGPTLDEFSFSRVKLIDQVGAGVTDKQDSVVVQRNLREMTGTLRRRGSPRDKLVISRAGLRLQDTKAAIRIEARIFAAVAEVDEV